MTVLEISKTPNNIKIQIEDWNDEYSFMPYGRTIGAYPVAKQSINKQFAPKANEKFRYQLDFSNYNEAKQAFQDLESGKMELIDYKDNYNGKKDFLICL